MTPKTGCRMIHRFIMFVDGSNLLGVGKYIGLEFDDYEKLYRHLFEKSIDEWRRSFAGGPNMPAQLTRVYWYAVGSMDEWDLGTQKVEEHLRRQFDSDRDTKSTWTKLAAQSLREGGKPTDEAAVRDEAWRMCFRECQDWYDKKRTLLDGMRRFYHAVEAQTDFIEIRRVGHWKVNFFSKSLEEKRLDTSFAVDMVAMMPAYEVAVLISGDADGIPSVNHVKNSGRHVGAVEFLKGYPPEARAKNLSPKLKIAADFVTPIYEMDLVRSQIARKTTP